MAAAVSISRPFQSCAGVSKAETSRGSNTFCETTGYRGYWRSAPRITCVSKCHAFSARQRQGRSRSASQFLDGLYVSFTACCGCNSSPLTVDFASRTNAESGLFFSGSKATSRADCGNVRMQAASERNLAGDADSGFIRSKLAVFLSGGGSNFRALHESTLKNTIFGDIVVVISDKPSCKGCKYAEEYKIPVLSYPRSTKHAPEGLSSSELVEALRELGVDYVLLAGYLKLIPEDLVKAYPRSILNIHPALLPAFGGKGYFGAKVHEAVIKSGARFSGPTVHFVDETYDSGPILAQRVVPVLADDTPVDLAARVLREEHLLYPEAVAALCEDRVFWREDGVPIIRRSWDGPSEYY